MPKTPARQLRHARRHHPYGISADRRAALRNPWYTRSQRRVLREFNNGEYYLQPAAPRHFFKGSRPGWRDQDAIWAAWGGKGKVRCRKCKVAVADTIDHHTDWQTYVLDQCDWHREKCKGGVWEGLLREDVINAYNDRSNLQPMCTACNSRKNGPKNIDKLRPVFFRRK